MGLAECAGTPGWESRPDPVASSGALNGVVSHSVEAMSARARSATVDATPPRRLRAPRPRPSRPLEAGRWELRTPLSARAAPRAAAAPPPSASLDLP
ncbi:hypothetical protein QJS66_12470 [Kocuria rhizophila]|nr:hypothetical protein QJS66_12470 [Kocuria rhizophila]